MISPGQRSVGIAERRLARSAEFMTLKLTDWQKFRIRELAASPERFTLKMIRQRIGCTEAQLLRFMKINRIRTQGKGQEWGLTKALRPKT
jgi:hypothetical protein